MEPFLIGGASFIVFLVFFLIYKKLKNINERQDRIETNQGLLLSEITKTKQKTEELHSKLYEKTSNK